VTSGPYADPTSTVPGQTWDDVAVTVTGTGPDFPIQAPVTDPDGNGTVTVTSDTTGMAVGTYTVTITGRLLTLDHFVPGQEPQLWLTVYPLMDPRGTRRMTRHRRSSQPADTGHDADLVFARYSGSGCRDRN
jgi:hypothetical protein